MDLNLRYSVPLGITESNGIDFLIEGVAINETITSNNHKFVAEELKLAASSLMGVPLLVDHENKVENIKGRVILSGYDETMKRVPFKAKVMDKMCQDMIKDGRLNSVSVGATVKEVEDDGDGHLIPRGIEFKELSLVAVPADSGATFQIALKEAYQASKLVSPVKSDGIKSDVINSIANTITGEVIITTEPLIKEEVKTEISNSSKSPNEMKGGLKMSEQTTETVVDSKIQERLDATEKANKELTESNKKLSDQLAILSAPKVEKVELEEKEESNVPYTIESGYNSFSVIMNKY